MLFSIALPLRAQEPPPTAAMVLYGGFAASVGADVASTLRFRATCPTCYEANPLMRPFVDAGSVPTVTVSVAGAAGLIWLSEYLRHQPETKRIWWVLPALATGAHLFVALQNPVH